MRKGRTEMPYAVTSDNVRLYFEEAGSGTPIIFLHEFAADYTNWEPQMRYFSRGHRCIAYSARGYTPSDVPPSAADLHLQAFLHRRARGARSPQDRQGASRRAVDGLLFVAADRPQRAGARAVDDAGRRRLGLRASKISRPFASNAGPMPSSSRRSARPRSRRSRARRRAGFRSCSRTRAASRISTPRWRGTMPRARPTPCAASRAAGPRSTP